MRWLLFLSRLAFLCGIFFILAISLQIRKWTKDEDIAGTIITIGVFMGLLIVPVTNLCYLTVFIIKRRLKLYVPLWLVVANVLFLVLIAVYIFFLNHQS